ncbi:MAG: GAF domain-containing protein [Chloroflexota bacterium]|nr:GAF domain-containing protein [Chloroflexota bacterium]
MTGVRGIAQQKAGAEPVAEHYRRQLEAIANNATLALFIMDERQHCMDERQHCTYMNLAAEALTGYALADVRGRPLHDVIHHTRPDGSPYPLSECPIDRAFPQNNREQGEETFVHRDGHFYPVAYTASPIREGSALLGTIIEVQDLTRRKQEEWVATERQRLLAFNAEIGRALSLADALPIVLQRCAEALVEHFDAAVARIWTLDEAGRTLVLRASAGLYTHLDGRHGRVPLGCYRIGQIAEWRRPHLTNAVLGDPGIGDQEWARREGMVAFAGYPLVVEDRLVGVIAMFARRPLSELVLQALPSVAVGIAVGVQRKQVEAELREQTEVVEAINRIGQMLTAELDLNRLLQAVTDVATELAGAQFGAFFYNVLDERGESYTLYTLSGVPREAFAQFPMPRNTAIFGPTFRGEGVVRLDDVNEDPRYGKNPPYRGMPKGHLPVRSYLALPIFSRSGEVLGGLFFGHGEPGVFTARAERLLTGIAAQAGIAIDNARLFAQAQDAIRLRDEFLSIASHELRNPVAGIKGAAQMLRRAEERGQLDRERQRRYVGIIDHAAMRLATLTEDLLDVSRLRAGGLPLRPQPVDVAELVDAVARRVHAHDDVDRIAVELDCAPCSAVVDPDRLGQVVENLLSNAIKYSPDGGEIRVTLTVDGDDMEVCVRDSGIGLPGDALERIFEPFGRAQNALERNIEGLGLGLYICRQIVEQHGGRLWAESAGEGQGTTMLLRLPRSGPPIDTRDGDGPAGG